MVAPNSKEKKLTRQMSLGDFLTKRTAFDNDSKGLPMNDTPQNQPSLDYSADQHSIIVDIGAYNLKKLTDEEKFRLANDHFVPPSDFQFPYTEKKSRGRIEKLKASHSHLEKYKWLVFSSIDKGYYCLPCALMLNSAQSKILLGRSRLVL